MEWEDLRLVLALHRAGTTSLAAENLGVNQSTVSRRLATLREESSRQWFVREGRRLVATPAGEEVIAAAVRMEKEVLRVERSLAGLNEHLEGLVRLSGHQVVVTHLLANSLVAFTREYQSVQLQIESDRDLSELERKRIDVLIRICDSPPPDLVGRRYGKFTYALYRRHDTSDDAPYLAYPGPRGDLADRDWIHELTPRRPIQCRIESDYTQYQLVRSGMGVAQLPCMLGDHDPLLERVPQAPLEQGSELWVLTHRELQTCAPVAALMTHLHENLKELRPRIEGTCRELSQ